MLATETVLVFFAASVILALARGEIGDRPRFHGHWERIPRGKGKSRSVPGLVLLLFFAGQAAAQPGSVFIEDLTSPEVRAAIASGKTAAIYYAGSTEQNGPHMATGKHNFVARHVAQRIAEALGDALVYPVMPFAPTGDPVARTDHMRFAGSVSVSEATFAAVARDVALSAIAAGFRHVFLMGDHGGGQEALGRVAAELDREWRGRGVRVQHVPDLYFRTEEQVRAHLAQRGLAAGAHAGLPDTSELMFVDRAGRWVRRERLAPGDAGNGVDGDPRQASAASGKLFIRFKVDNAVRQIRGFMSSNR